MTAGLAFALGALVFFGLGDLIYKRGQAGVTKASVTIVFENKDKKKSPIGFEEYATISVTRQIVLGGTSKYLINGHRAQQQTVQNLFQSVQLNINNPNFLIMQGRITKVGDTANNPRRSGIATQCRQLSVCHHPPRWNQSNDCFHSVPKPSFSLFHLL